VKSIKNYALWITGLLAVIAGTALAVVFLRKKRSVAEILESVGHELTAIKAERKAAIATARWNRNTALQERKEQHAETLAALDERQRAEAESLSEDPQKLARFLVNAGRRNHSQPPRGG